MNPYTEPTITVQLGSQGDSVRWAQWMLAHLGYPIGSAGINGVFGPELDRAVRQFQIDNGLDPDGIVGIATRIALGAALGIAPEPAPGPYQNRKIADVSQYQGVIDWQQAAQDLDFAILRVQADEVLDRQFALNVAGAQANEVPFGVYAYLRSGTEEAARDEARRFFNRARYANPIFYVVDVESLAGDDMRAVVSAFVDELRQLGVEKIGLYISHHLYEQLNLNTDEVDFIWLPRYGDNTGYFQVPPDYPADLQQYTSRGRLAGVVGDVDLNRLTGTIPLEWFTTY